MDELERKLLDVLADVQALRQTNEKLDMILESRDLAGANAAHERSCVGAPLEAVQEENLEGESLELEESNLRKIPHGTGEPDAYDLRPHFGTDMQHQEEKPRTRTEQKEQQEPTGDEAYTRDGTRDGLCSFPSFEAEASFPGGPEVSVEEAGGVKDEPAKNVLVLAEEQEAEHDAEEDDPELNAMWESFFPAQAFDLPSSHEVPVEAAPAEATPTPPSKVSDQQQDQSDVQVQDRPQGKKGTKDVTSMSRRERIRLLEREEALLEAQEMSQAMESQESHGQPSRCQTSGETEEEVFEDSAQLALHAAHALHEHLQGVELEEATDPNGIATRKERIALLQRGVAGENIVDEADFPPCPSDSQWDARRQHRKARLQRKKPAVDCHDVELTTVLPQDAVECLAGDEKLAAYKSLARHSHRLDTESLVRAVELMLAGPKPQTESDALACAESLLGNLSAQMGSLGFAPLMNCLKLMAYAEVQEQTYLDMLLAQLLVLFRRDGGSFSPSMLTPICGALGHLQEVGISAKRGASGSNCTANRRCLEMLTQLLTRHILEFAEEELATLGASFVLNYMDDVLRRSVLRQAATLQAGLGDCPTWVTNSMVHIEEAVRTHSFAFIASLPDESKDYLLKLKTIRQANENPASGLL